MLTPKNTSPLDLMGFFKSKSDNLLTHSKTILTQQSQALKYVRELEELHGKGCFVMPKGEDAYNTLQRVFLGIFGMRAERPEQAKRHAQIFCDLAPRYTGKKYAFSLAQIAEFVEDLKTLAQNKQAPQYSESSAQKHLF